MDREAKRQILLHYAVSSVGGFFGGYAIINHCDIFGNAQTANLIHIVTKIFSTDFSGLIFLLLSLFTYMAGNAFCVLAEKFIKLDLRIISLALSCTAVLIIGLAPNVSNNYIALLPILFVTPIQWNAFKSAGGYVSSSIFSTNNLRQATMSLTSYIVDRDKKQRDKAVFFWSTLCCFHSGVALSCVTSVFIGVESIWFCFIPIALSCAAYYNLIRGNLKSSSKGTISNKSVKA